MFYLFRKELKFISNVIHIFFLLTYNKFDLKNEGIFTILKND